MSLSQTPSAERLHIGFFGMRNAGKSSLVNAVTGQAVSLVSSVKGTTTDPVKKAMELLPLGPVVIIDTPGMDDEGALGGMRVSRAKEMLDQVNIAVLAVDAAVGMREEDRALLALIQEKKIAHVVCLNKCDLLETRSEAGMDEILVSAATGEGIDQLKERLGRFAGAKTEKKIVADLLKPGDLALLVVPVDESAPKGRLILPQQQTIRELLDHHMMAMVCQDTEVRQTLAMLSVKPKLVITDSQAFGRVSKDVPKDIMLTSFSILFARYKGSLPMLLRGAAALDRLEDGDRVLIAEGCTHHRQCNDIGTVKMPRWIEAHTGKKLEYAFCSGGEFPQDLGEYALVVHCGGCTLTEQMMKARLGKAKAADVPVINYGMAIAHMHGILERSLEVFPDAAKLIGK
ncbi:MAG: [FeFe] hydrogenase H-cluster maturation GTPase HydF [Clostridiales bacterium]|nr:[FeFe] hydrogenase H-cluster maturation GTPase HydF [Clostridiales bacterium]